MEKQIIKVMTVNLFAVVGIFALMPATDFFGMSLIEGEYEMNRSSAAGLAVYLFLLAYGGRLLFGDRLFVDPIRKPVVQTTPVPVYAYYQRRFGRPFMPGTRGLVQVTPQYQMTPDLNRLSSRFELALGRKLDRLERRQDNPESKTEAPVLV
jgi:hypothetical protein